MHRLVAVEGPDLGRVFALTDFPITLGRGYEAKIRLADGSVSRIQARIEVGARGPSVVDCQSTNGTKVNGKRVTEHRLAHGDEIAFGKTRLRFESDGGGDLEISRADGLTSRAAEGRTVLKSETAERIPVESDERTLIGVPSGRGRADPEAATRALLTLYRLDHALAPAERDEPDPDAILVLLLDAIAADRGAIVLLDRASGELTPAAARDRAGPADMRVSQTLLDEVTRTREAVLVYDTFADARFADAASLVGREVRSCLCAPLATRDKVLGAIVLEATGDARRFASADLRLCSAVASKTAVAVANVQLRRELKGLFYNTLEAIVDAIQMKDPYTKGHSERVRRYSLLLARELGTPPEFRRRCHISAVLHDVGKIGMPDRLLFNTDELTAAERLEVQYHPVRGAEFLQKIPALHDVIDGVKYHHENWDGTGYPDKLKGDAIPLLGRIVAVADTFDACTTDRPYQKAVSKPEAVRILRRLKGTRLDPTMVDAFERALRTEGLLRGAV